MTSSKAVPVTTIYAAVAETTSSKGVPEVIPLIGTTTIRPLEMTSYGVVMATITSQVGPRSVICSTAGMDLIQHRPVVLPN